MSLLCVCVYTLHSLWKLQLHAFVLYSRNFTWFYNYRYGNCYTYNSEVNSSDVGPLYGKEWEFPIHSKQLGNKHLQNQVVYCDLLRMFLTNDFHQEELFANILQKHSKIINKKIQLEGRLCLQC